MKSIQIFILVIIALFSTALLAEVYMNDYYRENGESLEPNHPDDYDRNLVNKAYGNNPVRPVTRDYIYRRR